jgi:hypothetical protein
MPPDVDIQKQIDELNQEKARIDAQKALADSQKALADSQHAADQSKSGASQQLADLQNQKALADAQKALADSKKALDPAAGGSAQQVVDLQNQKALIDAQKALMDSQTQALLARLIGDVKGGPFSGSVDMKDKAGTQEAALLAARAIREAAALVAKAVPDEITNIHIFPAKDFPGFQRLLAFRFRKELIKEAFNSAGVKRPAAETEAIPVPISAAAVSAGLDAVSKLLDFFKTDFTVGGTDVKLDESLLLFAVAGRLSGKGTHLPLTYDPGSRAQAVAGITTQLGELVDLRTRAVVEAGGASNRIAANTKLASDPANAAGKDDLNQKIANDKARVDQLNGLIALYDAFVGGLTTPDSNGSAPIVFLAQEFSIDSALTQGGAVLLLRLENAGGGFLVKKNLLTGLGAMPMFHMGGATVTYLLLKGPTGEVIAGDVVPVHGGFVRSDKMREVLNEPTIAAS